MSSKASRHDACSITPARWAWHWASGKPVIFRLVRSGGGYLVQDINVSSVWLAQQLRANFVGVIRRGGDIAALFAYLRG